MSLFKDFTILGLWRLHKKKNSSSLRNGKRWRTAGKQCQGCCGGWRNWGRAHSSPELTLGIQRPEEIVHRKKIGRKKKKEEQTTQKKDSRFCRGSCRQSRARPPEILGVKGGCIGQMKAELWPTNQTTHRAKEDTSQGRTIPWLREQNQAKAPGPSLSTTRF